MTAPTLTGAVRLNLGCGSEKRAGYVNVDVDPAVGPDVVASADDLSMFADESVDVVESYHLFEHFTYFDALRCLREWHRVLRPGGLLVMELPNFWRCIEELYHRRSFDHEDLFMCGVFGWPPMTRGNVFQCHKWGWVPWELEKELRAVGFADVRFKEPTQRWRRAFPLKRDMRVEARKPGGRG